MKKHQAGFQLYEEHGGWWRKSVARAIFGGLDVLMRSRFRLHVRGLHNFTNSPSTLVVANHRRDTDGPIIGGVLLRRTGLRALGAVPNFVAREDLFRRGFLREYLETWPNALRELLSPLNVSFFLRLAQVHPMRRVPERTLGEVLEDVRQIFGDLPLCEVLKPSWVARFETIAGSRGLSVSQVLRARFRTLLRLQYGLLKLTRQRFTALKPFERAVIESHLQRFVELLEQGELVQIEPEGGVSTDGRYLPLRGGLHVLLNRPQAATRVLPVGITYDFMTSGSQTVFVNIGEEMLDLRGLSRRDTDRRVSKAMVAQSTVTASQLASRMLLALRDAGGGEITDLQLERHIAAEVRHCTAAGAYVDPRLLRAEERVARVTRYLEYCAGAGTVIPLGHGRFHVREEGAPVVTWTDPVGAIDYVNNELASLMRQWPSVPEASSA